MKINTALGIIDSESLGITLPHEHICCYYEQFYQICRNRYLDKELLREKAIEYLKYMKQTYGLNTFVDCTPINIGRDIELIKEVSDESEVNIITSTGFYYFEEPLVNSLTTADIAEKIAYDAVNYSNAGLLKIAFDKEELSGYNKKIIDAISLVHKELNLPVCVHSNGNNKSGKNALERLLANGVKPGAITIGHLSDSNDLSYVEEILKYGCYIGFDRIDTGDDAYMQKKADDIYSLDAKGYGDKILISHDELIFNGFVQDCRIKNFVVYERIFSRLVPFLKDGAINKFFVENPKNMLCCK